MVCFVVISVPEKRAANIRRMTIGSPMLTIRRAPTDHDTQACCLGHTLCNIVIRYWDHEWYIVAIPDPGIVYDLRVTKNSYDGCTWTAGLLLLLLLYRKNCLKYCFYYLIILKKLTYHRINHLEKAAILLYFLATFIWKVLSEPKTFQIYNLLR